VDAGWDVKGLVDVSTVDKVEKKVSPSARGNALFIRLGVFQPGGVDHD